MRRLFIVAAMLIAAFTSCGSRPEVVGTYKGVLPAADCPGIEYSLTLSEDGSYSLKMVYQERNSEFTESGTYEYVESVVITTAKDGNTGKYRLEGDRLRYLDLEGNPIEGPMADLYLLRREK